MLLISLYFLPGHRSLCICYTPTSRKRFCIVDSSVQGSRLTRVLPESSVLSFFVINIWELRLIVFISRIVHEDFQSRASTVLLRPIVFFNTLSTLRNQLNAS